MQSMTFQLLTTAWFVSCIKNNNFLRVLKSAELPEQYRRVLGSWFELLFSWAYNVFFFTFYLTVWRNSKYKDVLAWACVKCPQPMLMGKHGNYRALDCFLWCCVQKCSVDDMSKNKTHWVEWLSSASVTECHNFSKNKCSTVHFHGVHCTVFFDGQF